MSNAKQCDRCGVYFPSTGQYKLNGKEVENHLTIPRWDITFPIKEIDLCDTCMREFIEWYEFPKKQTELKHSEIKERPLSPLEKLRLCKKEN